MADTPRLVMPEITESQASKYVTHNEALRVLDALVQCCVDDMDLTAPPSGPTDGDLYVVGTPTDSTSGDWNGEDLNIAYYNNSAWEFHTPEEGWIVYAKDEDKFYYYAGASLGWVELGTATGATFTGLSDTPASYSGQGGKGLQVNSGETVVEFVSRPYDIGACYEGKPASSAVLLRIPAVRTIDFADDFSGSEGVVGVAPTAQAVFIIKKNGVQFGTMTFAGAATTATFATDSAGEQFTAGDVVTVEAPASQDASLANVGFLLKASQA